MVESGKTPGPSYERVNRIRITALIAVVGAASGAGLAHVLLGVPAPFGIIAGALIGAPLFLGLAYRLRR
jgi:hypothetical protein